MKTTRRRSRPLPDRATPVQMEIDLSTDRYRKASAPIKETYRNKSPHSEILRDNGWEKGTLLENEHGDTFLVTDSQACDWSGLKGQFNGRQTVCSLTVSHWRKVGTQNVDVC